ncbi:WD40 repeat [Fusarium beomiforme]|uniref:WD40 repeat n=1 Tax=Fusarium beomiforme TaxID=44412 RepID=A0A9P5A5Z1_9HYPO|nr:WD40 repeat [Fusarium beomiforme]
MWNLARGIIGLLPCLRGGRLVKEKTSSCFGKRSGASPERQGPSDKERGKKLQGHSQRVTALEVSPNEHFLASGSQDGTVKLWELGGVQVKSFDLNSGAIHSLAVAPNNGLVAAASAAGVLGLWNLEKGDGHRLEGHTSEVLLLKFSPDGKLPASCSVDGTVRVWVTTGEFWGILNGHSDRVTDLAFSPDSQFLVSCSTDGTVLLWYLATQAVFATMTGHEGVVSSVVFSSDGEQILSCSYDNTIRFWSREGTATGFIKHDTAQFNSIAFSPDNRMLVSSSKDQTIRIWDSETKACKGFYQVYAPVDKVPFTVDCKNIKTNRGFIRLESLLTSSPPLPLDSSYQAFEMKEWLSGRTRNTIYLPDEGCQSILAAHKMALGHSSGRISFIDLRHF